MSTLLAKKIKKENREKKTVCITEKRVIIASVFGTVLEFYDFLIYNYFVVHFSVLFFPKTHDKHLGLLLALATIGVSFLMRPLGGLLIGRYADRYGRKPAMIVTIALMSVGTLMIGCTPTYIQIGYLGTIILVIARLLQGLAAGGEVGAANAMLIEAAPANKRGFYGSWSVASQGLATFVGGTFAFILGVVLPDITGNPDVMLAWGWRIPFLIGFVLAIIGCKLRLNLINESAPSKPVLSSNPVSIEETHHQIDGVMNQKEAAIVDITDIAKANGPSTNIFKHHWRELIIGVLLVLGTTVGTYISLYYYSIFSVAYFDMPQLQAHLAMLIGGFITFIGSLLVGYLCDHTGRKKLIAISRIAMIVLGWPSYWLLIHYPNPIVLFIIVFITVSFVTLGSVPTILVMIELLPKRIRSTGFAVTYSLSVAIFGGFAQWISSQLIEITNDYTSPSWYLMITSLISLLALFMFKETKGRAIHD